MLGGEMTCEDENVLSAIRAEVGRRIAEREAARMVKSL